MQHLALITLSLIAFAGAQPLAACGDDEDPATTSTCLTLGPVVDILDNHRTTGGDHKLVVTAEDVAEGVDQAYDIRGDNTGHTHEVVITAADFASLAAGTTVTITSSNNGSVGASHTHEVRLSCP